PIGVRQRGRLRPCDDPAPQVVSIPPEAGDDGPARAYPFPSAGRELLRGLRRCITPPTGAFHSRNGSCLAGANAWRLVPRAAPPSVLSLRLQPETGLGAGTLWYRAAGGNRSPRLPAQKRANTSRRGGRRRVRSSGELSWRLSEIA